MDHRAGPGSCGPLPALLRGRSGSEGCAATLIEYLSYTFIAAALSIAALVWLLANGTLDGAMRAAAIVILSMMAAFLVSGAAAIAMRVHLLGGILERVAALPGIRRRLRPNMTDVHRVEDLLLDVMHDRPARFARILFVEAIGHALHILELFLILHALVLGATMGTAVLIEGAAKFIGIAFFEAVDLPAVAGFTVPFIRRIRSIVVAALGLAAISMLTRAHARAGDLRT